MLVHEPRMLQDTDSVLAMIAALNGNTSEVEELRRGVYLIGHFNGEVPGYNRYPNFYLLNPDDSQEEVESREHIAQMTGTDRDLDWSRNCYGVCDDLEQLLSHFPELEAPGREFYVTLTEVRRDNQPAQYGWRWHKWGPYIGTHEKQCEYLYDEVGIDRVFCYHIYERSV